MIKLNEEYRHRLVDSDIISRYIRGGRGIVTLEAPSGKSHTYAYKKPQNASEFPDDVIFVYAVHDKQKLFYIGMMEGLNFRLTHNSRFLEDTEIVRGAQYIVKMASYKGLPERSKMQLYHEGICCRCGRPLTSEKSIEEGAGPRCLRESFLAYAHSRLDDLKKFRELEKKSGNPYLAIQKLAHKSRKLGKTYKGVNDSHLITCALYDEQPSMIRKNRISIESSYEDDILSRVSNEEVVISVKLSLKYSTRDHVQYVYTDSLEKCDESRVQVLVNMILDH